MGLFLYEICPREVSAGEIVKGELGVDVARVEREDIVGDSGVKGCEFARGIHNGSPIRGEF